jgi:DNA-binding transcriptional ArsR family regulator
MGIFGHLQNEIEDREKRDGISLAELLDLSPPLRRLMNRIARQGEQTVEEAAEHLKESPDQVREWMNALVEKGYLDREKREDVWHYKIRFAYKRGADIPLGLWSVLGDLDKE